MKKTAAPTIASPTTPPTTPPAIAPALEEEPLLEGEGLDDAPPAVAELLLDRLEPLDCAPPFAPDVFTSAVELAPATELERFCHPVKMFPVMTWFFTLSVLTTPPLRVVSEVEVIV